MSQAGRPHGRSAALAVVALVGILGVPARAAEEGSDPPSPFGKPSLRRTDAIEGAIRTSDGAIHVGRIYLTRDKKYRLWLVEEKRYADVPPEAVAEVRQVVAEEHLEKEWRWKEHASDEKVYTGRSYPWRRYTTEIELKKGRKLAGESSGLVYLDPGGEAKPIKFFLYGRQKGDYGQKLADLVYVKSIKYGKEAVEGARREIDKRKASEAKEDPSDEDHR